MQRYSKSILTLLIISLLSGCNSLINQPNSPKRLVNKDEVSVQDALTQIGKGISNMKTELDKNQTKAGLYIDTIDLDIVLSAGQTEHGNVSLTINPIDFKQFSNSSGNVNSALVKDVDDLRSSTLKIRFKSVNSYRLALLDALSEGSVKDDIVGEDLHQNPANFPYKEINPDWLGPEKINQLLQEQGK